MAAPILPLLAVLAGGLLLSRNRGGRSSKRRLCTPEKILGPYVSLGAGGYPAKAADIIGEWIYSGKAGGTEVFFKNQHAKVQAATNAMTAAQDAAAMSEAQRAHDVVTSDVVGSAWSIADAYLKSIGCPVIKSTGDSLPVILENKEMWLRWIFAMGAYSSMLDVAYVSESDHQSDALTNGMEFLTLHFDFELDDMGGKLEIDTYAGMIEVLLRPKAGAVQRLEAKIDKMDADALAPTWMFQPLPTGEPLLLLEDRLLRLIKDFSVFLTGKFEEHGAGTHGSLMNELILTWGSALVPWFGRYIGLSYPMTWSGNMYLYEIITQMLGGKESPFAVPQGWRVKEVIDAEDSPYLPFSIARGRLTPTWWLLMTPGIKACFAQGKDLEEVSVRIVSGFIPGSPAGLCDGDASVLEQMYPSYTRFWKEHPNADYEEFTAALAKFKATSPMVDVAISNMMTLIQKRFPTDGVDFGFGG